MCEEATYRKLVYKNFLYAVELVCDGQKTILHPLEAAELLDKANRHDESAEISLHWILAAAYSPSSYVSYQKAKEMVTNEKVSQSIQAPGTHSTRQSYKPATRA